MADEPGQRNTIRAKIAHHAAPEQTPGITPVDLGGKEDGLADPRGTWLESHFRWQIRTFWLGLPWFILGFLTYIFIIGWFVLVAAALWLIYRILKGWLSLNDGKPLNV